MPLPRFQDLTAHLFGLHPCFLPMELCIGVGKRVMAERMAACSEEIKPSRQLQTQIRHRLFKTRRWRNAKMRKRNVHKTITSNQINLPIRRIPKRESVVRDILLTITISISGSHLWIEDVGCSCRKLINMPKSQLTMHLSPPWLFGQEPRGMYEKLQ